MRYAVRRECAPRGYKSVTADHPENADPGDIAGPAVMAVEKNHLGNRPAFFE
jgi:hypothetical protein